MRLRAGDRVIAHTSGKTGRAVVVEDQGDDELVKFSWEQSRPGAKPVVALASRVILIPQDDDPIERIERKHDI